MQQLVVDLAYFGIAVGCLAVFCLAFSVGRGIAR